MLQKKVKKRASLLATLLLVSILAIFFILPTFSNSLTAERKLNIVLPRFEPSAIIVSV